MLELFLFIYLKVFIYLAALGLSCGTPDLPSLLQHMGSVVAAMKLLVASYELLAAACGI